MLLYSVVIANLISKDFKWNLLVCQIFPPAVKWAWFITYFYTFSNVYLFAIIYYTKQVSSSCCWMGRICRCYVVTEAAIHDKSHSAWFILQIVLQLLHCNYRNIFTLKDVKSNHRARTDWTIRLALVDTIFVFHD